MGTAQRDETKTVLIDQCICESYEHTRICMLDTKYPVEKETDNMSICLSIAYVRTPYLR